MVDLIESARAELLRAILFGRPINVANANLIKKNPHYRCTSFGGAHKVIAKHRHPARTICELTIGESRREVSSVEPFYRRIVSITMSVR
jgi:hypothetical protein